LPLLSAARSIHTIFPMSDRQNLSYAVWATAWGPMGGVMAAAGLRRIVLPHYQRDQLSDLLKWEFPGATRDEKPFEELIALCREYFNAHPVDFSAVRCELPSQRSFAGKVLRACAGIGYAQTRSYGSLAEQIGRPDAARAVAAALGKNRIPLVIPCHRVTYADGRAGGFSAAGGPELKKRLLALEQKVSRPSAE